MPSLKMYLSSFLLLAAPISASAFPDIVDVQRRAKPYQIDGLRIEGSSSTIFEAPIISGPTNVTTPSGGTHLCNGQNDGANPNPSATPTTALQAAAHFAGFPFDGTFDTEFDDFFITSIGPDSETATEFWGLLVDYQFTPTGGCQFEVKPGDKVLWAFNAFNAVHFLELSGPELVEAREVYHLTVTDGSTGEAVSGATVGTATSDANGIVTLTAPAHPAITEFKAERSDSIRSNRHVVAVI
jgi:hypothetical protein